jgi:hypothetical protein
MKFDKTSIKIRNTHSIIVFKHFQVYNRLQLFLKTDFFSVGWLSWRVLGVTDRATAISALDAQTAKLEGAPVFVCIYVVKELHYQNINYIWKRAECLLWRELHYWIYIPLNLSERDEIIYLSYMILPFQRGA